jgi:hypothetical protein
MEDEQKAQRTTVVLPLPLHKALRVVAAREGLSATDIIIATLKNDQRIKREMASK